MAIQKLDISPLGSDGTVWTGNVGVSSGTITSLPNIPGGTITNLASGTINAATAILNSGTINVGTFVMPSGTVTVLPNLPQGSINVTAGTIATLGTMGTLGLVNTVTTVSNVTNGSIVVTAGTIAAHAITAATVTAGSINVVAGTIATLGTMGTLGLVNTVTTITTLSNLTAGSVNIPAGTITSVTNLASGTLLSSGTTTGVGTITNLGQVYNAGTVQNVNFGTIAISDGTTKANVMASGVSNGTAAQNAQLIAGGFAEISGSATGGTASILASQEVSNYRWFSLHMYGTWVGTANLQFSNDNTNWITSGGVAVSSNTNGISTTISSNNIYHGPVFARYLRLQSAAFTSGTMQAIMELYTSPQTLHSQGATSAQSGAWNVTGTIAAGSIAVTAGTITSGTINIGTVTGDVASGATDSGNPLKVGGKYNSTMPTYTDGQRGNVELTTRGALKVALFTNDTNINAVYRTDNADGVAVRSGSDTLAVSARNSVFNGTAWDRQPGTVDGAYMRANPLPAVNAISHAGTSGTLGIGTLVGTASIGAGTALYPTNYRLVVLSGTAEIILAFGTQTNGNQVIHHGNYAAGGGIASPIPFPHAYGTSASPLTYQILSGAGTVAWDVDYFTHT